MAPRLVIDRRTVRLILLAFLLLAGLTVHRLFLAEPPESVDPADVMVLQGSTMGTSWNVRVTGDALGPALHDRIAAETERRLAQVDHWMSTWNPDSEISRFNAYQGSEPFPVSFETASVVAYALEVEKRSGGAFDVTVAPLVAVWGFGQEARSRQSPPGDEEIEALLGHVGGTRTIAVLRGSPKDGGFLIKKDPETRVDLSAIAKGFGVDHVADGLLALGREDFLVEIGGEVRAVGERPGGGPWRLAVEKPIENGRAIQEVVLLSNQSMATSGDYRIFYRQGDKRFSHTLDPRTGRPVQDGPASATVIAPSCTMADAWATALMVLGPDPGLEIATQTGIGAMLLLRDRGVRDDGDAIVSVRNELFP